MLSDFMRYALYSRLSYYDDITQMDLNLVTAQSHCVKPVKYLNNMDGQGWIFEDVVNLIDSIEEYDERDVLINNCNNSELIIALRGTDSIFDAVHNLTFVPVDYKNCGKVHMGYLNYYKTIRHDIQEAIDSYLNNDYLVLANGANGTNKTNKTNKTNGTNKTVKINGTNTANKANGTNTANGTNKAVTFIGHSLGGSSATLGAFETSMNKDVFVRCVSFGAPPIGNSAFCEHFKNQVPMSYRFVNDKDIVPKMPFHKHVHGCIHLNKPKSLIVPKPKLWANMSSCISNHSVESYIYHLRRSTDMLPCNIK